ncbi:MAG: MerR family transcriptional regulator [Candidatus Dependentiae bacterium]|jgi:MerR family transcriptional regulator/heat shock protein HspR
MKRRKGYYSISVVAKMFDVHQQTIRLYEKEGLISPERTAGGTRLFSEEDVDRLEEIINLTHKMGVNISGVEMILKLQRKIKKLQDDMNKLFAQTQSNLEEEGTTLKKEAKENAQRLLSYKKGAMPPAIPKKSIESDAVDAEAEVVDDWEVEYDED